MYSVEQALNGLPGRYINVMTVVELVQMPRYLCRRGLSLASNKTSGDRLGEVIRCVLDHLLINEAFFGEQSVVFRGGLGKENRARSRIVVFQWRAILV